MLAFKFWFVGEALQQSRTCCNTSLLRQRGSCGNIAVDVWEAEWVAQEGAVLQQCRGSGQVLGAQSALPRAPRINEVKQDG